MAIFKKKYKTEGLTQVADRQIYTYIETATYKDKIYI